MVYFQYLESTKYLHVSNQYLYGELLVKASDKFEESVLVFLEMLKIFFPEGSKFDENWIPMSHYTVFKDFQPTFASGFEGYSQADQASCNLLTRVFCLFPFEQ
jgi:hypothetical protein